MGAAVIVAYALSPTDLIPAFSFFIDYLDEFILLPLDIASAIKLLPPKVLIKFRT
jgi:uncharacterized membrane protein YkvA (DUF1232 family)